MFKLRGHHLLCVHGFQGMGYSEEFIRKMEEVVDFIRDDQQDGYIQVDNQWDVLCKSCPNLMDEICQSSEEAEKKIRTMDEKVLNLLGLKTGGVYLKSELVQRTGENVTAEDLEKICNECSWLRYGTCKEGIAKLAKKVRG
jgi:hypothetical protein